MARNKSEFSFLEVVAEVIDERRFQRQGLQPAVSPKEVEPEEIQSASTPLELASRINHVASELTSLAADLLRLGKTLDSSDVMVDASQASTPEK